MRSRRKTGIKANYYGGQNEKTGQNHDGVGCDPCAEIQVPGSNAPSQGQVKETPGKRDVAKGFRGGGQNIKRGPLEGSAMPRSMWRTTSGPENTGNCDPDWRDSINFR